MPNQPNQIEAAWTTLGEQVEVGWSVVRTMATGRQFGVVAESPDFSDGYLSIPVRWDGRARWDLLLEHPESRLAHRLNDSVVISNSDYILILSPPR